jgi:hypothetical protein
LKDLNSRSNPSWGRRKSDNLDISIAYHTLNGMKHERVAHSKLDEIARVCTGFDLSVHT